MPRLVLDTGGGGKMARERAEVIEEGEGQI